MPSLFMQEYWCATCSETFESLEPRASVPETKKHTCGAECPKATPAPMGKCEW